MCAAWADKSRQSLLRLTTSAACLASESRNKWGPGLPGPGCWYDYVVAGLSQPMTGTLTGGSWAYDRAALQSQKIKVKTFRLM
jgi:hypothetical protein